MRARVSESSKLARVIEPVRNPRPSGANGMKATPCSAHQGTTSASASRVQSESSDCTEATGWIAWARASSSIPASDRPIALTLPARTSSAIAVHVSCTGTSGSISVTPTSSARWIVAMQRSSSTPAEP